MSTKLRINFILPPSASISGGPLAILEYANRFIDRGHVVSVTTYPDNMWQGESPFPWFDFKGPIYFKKTADRQAPTILKEANDLIEVAAGPHTDRSSLWLMSHEWATWAHTIQALPDCDINIATLWSTAFPAYFSRKGKPVIFLQHYEEVFYSPGSEAVMFRLLARTAMSLPIYKIANSSWLQRELAERFGQTVPYSNNAIEQSDFGPARKKSADDGIVRVVTYSRPEDWKGFADAVAAMAEIRIQYGDKVEWHVFGYRHETLTPGNSWAPYAYHPKLSFKQLANLYATADIVLCPSWYESFPLPPLEGMASGTAVVTTKAGTEDYVFDGQNALAIDSRDVGAMVTALRRLIDDGALRAALASRALKTASQFTWDRAVSEREALLLDIYYDRVDYDRERGVMLGLTDANDRFFERAPSDALAADKQGLFWSFDHHLYLIHNGVRRHVTDGHLIPVLLDRGWGYVDVEELQKARIPMGAPVITIEDVPYNRRRDLSDRLVKL